MRVSRNWLNRYVEIRESDADLAERLTMAGLEVESFEARAEGIAGIIVGEVRSVDRHPKADKLTVCRVFNGKGEVQVVCGAPNVAAGQKVAFAQEGASVPRNQHDPDGGPLRIGRVHLRGVESAGMICSAYELGLSEDHSGILVLDPPATPGTPLAKHLGIEDTIFEIGVTANRPDLLSHIGVAREVAAIVRRKVRLPQIILKESPKTTKDSLTVRIEDPAGCPRYTARVVRDVVVGPSPGWLRDALLSIGVRPVNNVVDVTNYVLMETGQPLHAFDYDKIGGRAIIVRRAEEGATFRTLDGKDRMLRQDTLMICDQTGPLAIAGVMGGQNSEITGSTRAVVIESAYFDSVSIRRTSKRLGLSTEASQRFERGADPNVTRWAADRAAALLADVAGGSILKGAVDVYPRKIRERRVNFDSRNCDRLLGVSIGRQKVSALFGRIGINNIGSRGKDGDVYAIPTWRPDVTREVDLIEEAARLYGYDNIGTAPRLSLALREVPPTRELSDEIRGYLSATGFREIVTNSMALKSDALLTEPDPVLIANPLSLEMAALRSSLLPGMLSTIKHNLFHGIASSRFYEIGNVFARLPGADPDSVAGYRQEERISLTIFGLESPVFWDEKGRNATIFTLKGEADALLRRISLDNPRYIPYSNPTALSERPISIELLGKVVGTLGSVSTLLRKRYDIESEVFFLDVSLDAVKSVDEPGRRYRAYPKFPVVHRDIAVVVDAGVPIGKVEGVIRDSAGPLLREVVLFDVYAGDQVGAGKKSCAFSLEFVPNEKTLEQHEILGIIDGITNALQSSLSAMLRQ